MDITPHVSECLFSAVSALQSQKLFQITLLQHILHDIVVKNPYPGMAGDFEVA